MNLPKNFPLCQRHNRPRIPVFGLPLIALLAVLLLSACAPAPAGQVAGYFIEQRLGGPVEPAPAGQAGSIAGQVLFQEQPVADASVLVATRTGTPFSVQTDAAGRYRIDGLPPGQYVPAAVAPGFEEAALTGTGGIPYLLTVRPGETAQAPPLRLQPHRPRPLPAPLPAAVELWAGAPYTATAPFPDGSIAWGQAFSFLRDGARIDSVRVYWPVQAGEDKRTLLFGSFPGEVDGWEPVSVALAGAGYTVVALSPAAARGIDVEAHAQDARLVLALARGGHLGVDAGDIPAVALGGSFTSAVLHRLLRDEGEQFAGWVTLGGISNAFSGSADFYAGRLSLPERFRLVIPALGPANVYPLQFLYYSPVYTAAHLPPTMIIHTAVDQIIPIDQAYELEAALRSAGVPVEVHYYEAASHYLQVGENITPAGRQMYWQVLNFVDAVTAGSE